MNRSGLHKRLLEEFPTDAEPTENHRLLARLPVAVYWTTNYDRLIERALEGVGKIVDPKRGKRSLPCGMLPSESGIRRHMHCRALRQRP